MTAQWNRCAHCGRYISFSDLESGRATQVLSDGAMLCTCAQCRREMRGEDEA